MLRITIPSGDYWDERKQEFFKLEGQTIVLEHSLVSVSKWESKWKKAYLTKDQKTREELVDYVRCMTLTNGVDPRFYQMLDNRTLNRITAYIDDPMTATTFSEHEQKQQTRSRQIITSELIYYWMVALQIPIEMENWHLNRLLTLIHICEIQNRTPKKQSKQDLISQHAKINAANKKRFGTRG